MQLLPSLLSVCLRTFIHTFFISGQGIRLSFIIQYPLFLARVYMPWPVHVGIFSSLTWSSFHLQSEWVNIVLCQLHFVSQCLCQHVISQSFLSLYICLFPYIVKSKSYITVCCPSSHIFLICVTYQFSLVFFTLLFEELDWIGPWSVIAWHDLMHSLLLLRKWELHSGDVSTFDYNWLCNMCLLCFRQLSHFTWV